MLRFFVVSVVCCSGCLEKPRLDGVRNHLSPIVNGSRTPHHVSLSKGQTLAIGFLTDADGYAICTGTLVESRLVITAQHCVYDGSPWEFKFGIGSKPSAARAIFPVQSIFAHPDHDFAALVLGQDTVERVPELEPIPMNTTPITDAWKNRWVDAAGFGETFTDEDGLFFASVQIQRYDDTTITVDGHGKEGICFGDSGGPILGHESTTGRVVVLGTEQWGDTSCVDTDHLGRVDSFAPWIAAITATGLPPALETCSAETGTRECDEYGRAAGCLGGFLHISDCPKLDKRCGFLSPDVGHDCLPATCNDVDYYGQCDGDTLVWCEPEGLRSRNCAKVGKRCEWSNDEDGYRCAGCYRCDGQCVNPMDSMEHCGGCNQACQPANGLGQCIEGECRVETCTPGFVDKDHDPLNGCEATAYKIGATWPWTLDKVACTAVPPGAAWALLVGLWGWSWRRRIRL